MKKIQFYIILPILLLILSACGGENASFEAGDIKDDFCGIHIDYQYCKCAFHNEFCEQIVMNKNDAKEYVEEEYDIWVEKEKQYFANKCTSDNGIYKKGKCRYCGEGKVVVDGKCKKEKADVEDTEEGTTEELTEGECRYDSDCDSICEVNTMWKMGCNARTNMCEKTFDTDCLVNYETFGDLRFSMICQSGECTRDNAAISKKREELAAEQLKASDELKALNKTRDDMNTLMLDTNKNCLNGIADMTNLAIVELATRVASLTAGGIPDLASASVDYVNDSINKLVNYIDGEPTVEKKKLKPEEYIKLNCDLYDYFKNEIETSGVKLDELVETAKVADEKLDKLPK